MPDHTGIVAIISAVFAGVTALVVALGGLRSKRDQSDREDDEQNEQDLIATRARLRRALAHIDRVTTVAFAIRHEAARRLMAVGDPAPLPEVPLFEDAPAAE